MKLIRYLLLALLVTAALWRLLPELKDLPRVIHVVQNTNLALIILAIFAQAGQYLGDGWLSQILLAIVGVRIDLKTTLKIASIDVFAAHLLPIGEGGVIATTFYIYRKLGVGNQSLIFLSIAWAAATGIVLVLLLIISTIFLPHLPNVPFHLSNLVAYTMIFLVLTGPLIYLNRNYLWPPIKRKLIKFKLYQEILVFTQNLKLHQEALVQNKLLIIKAFFAAFIYYATNIATLTICFLAFGYAPSIMLVTFAYLLSLIVSFLTLAPAGLGSTEATLLLIFLQYQIDPTLIVAAVLTFRLISFWLPIPLGFLSYLSLKSSRQ